MKPPSLSTRRATTTRNPDPLTTNPEPRTRNPSGKAGKKFCYSTAWRLGRECALGFAEVHNMVCVCARARA